MSVSVRDPNEADRERLRECLAQDVWHNLQDPERWLTDDRLRVFYDTNGHRVFVRLESVLRIHLQTEPDSPKHRIAGILINGFEGLAKWAHKKGFSEIVFESKAPELITFLEKRCGFKKLESDYSLLI